MANTAPYEVNVTGTDDETLAFTIYVESADGTPFPFDEFEFEYALRGSGRCLSLTQADGITVHEGTVTFRAPRGSLCPGLYAHGCRVRQVPTGEEVQIFDGTVTIGEGFFR